MRPSIPVGLSTKLMIGRETSSPSRTIANEPENCSAWLEEIPPHGEPVAAKHSSAPRWAICGVTSANASRPESVKLKSTVGWLNWSVPGFGSVIWSPLSAGLVVEDEELRAVADSSMSLDGSSSGSSSSTIVPCGTAITLVSACLSAGGS